MTLQSDNARLKKMLRETAKDWDDLWYEWEVMTNCLLGIKKWSPKYVVMDKAMRVLDALCKYDFNIGPKIRDGLKQMEEAPCEKTGD